MKNTNLVIPMAGHGVRFKDYIDVPKPWIPISGKPMIVRTAECLPPTKKQIFVCRKEHLEKYPIEKMINETYPNSECIGIDYTTRGLIFTSELGVTQSKTKWNDDDSLFISCCDNGVVYDKERYEQLRKNDSIDCIIWGVKNNPAVTVVPNAWEWIRVDADENFVDVSIKKQVSDNPYNDYMVVGNFEFKKSSDYLEAMNRIHKQVGTVTHEFYGGHVVNEYIKMGKNVVMFDADLYVSWGVPDQIRLFEAWEKYFKEFQSK